MKYYRVQGDRNIPQITKRRKNTWIHHILLRNCLLKHVMGRKIQGRIVR